MMDESVDLRPSDVDVHQDGDQNHAVLIPLLVIAALTCAASIAVCLRIPLKSVAPYLVGGSLLLLCGFGIRLVRSVGTMRILCVAVITTALAASLNFREVLQSCSFSAAVVEHPDAWSYATFGKYLWENPRGANSGLSIADEFGSHLSGTRFASSSMLGLLSTLVRGGDPASAMLLLFGICNFCFFLAVYYLSQSAGLSECISLAAAGLSITTGWMSNVFRVGNLDQLLFMPLFATVAAALVAVIRQPAHLRIQLFTIVLCLSAAFYTYPEGLAVAIFTALPLLLVAVYRVFQRGQGLSLGLVGIVSALLVAPYFPIARDFFVNQLNSSRGGLRPGTGIFSGLFNPMGVFPAAFALGEEYPGSTASVLNLFVPLALLALILVGLFRLREYLRVIGAILLAMAFLAGYQVAVRYDYGLYKVIALNSYLFFPLVAAGMFAVSTLSRRHQPKVFWVCILAIIAAVSVEAAEDTAHQHRLGCLTGIRELSSLQYVVQDKPVILDVDEPFSQLWAVYYLRDVVIRLPRPTSYLGMTHILPLLSKAKTSAEGAAGELRRGREAGALWSNGVFSLARPNDIELLSLTSPNGVETVAGKRFIWIGTEPLSLRVRTDRPGLYALRASRFLLGPSLPEKPLRNLLIESGDRQVRLSVDGTMDHIPLHIHGTESEVRIRCLDKPTVSRQANGDTRPLLLGLQAFWLERRQRAQ